MSASQKPSFEPLPTGGARALLSRVQAFLPEIANANVELEQKIREGFAHDVQIDASLVEEQEDVDGEEEGGESDSGAESASAASGTKRAASRPASAAEGPMIEMNLALGVLEAGGEGLLQEALGGAGQDQAMAHEEAGEEAEEEEEEVGGKQGALMKLLKESKKKGTEGGKADTKGASEGKKKGKLIQEL